MFSIIIPIHNAENTLNKCLDSLLNQTYGEFEAILVENGSSDKSFMICEKYSLRDKRFRAFSIGKCNGPSKPRNVGLKEAKGEYVAFLDADDWFAPKLLEMLNDCFSQSKADIVFFGFSDNKQSVFFPKVTTTDTKDICIQLNNQDCFGYTSCKSFRRSILDKIHFDETINLFEDELFALNALKCTNKVYVVSENYNKADYYYCKEESENSLMSKTHKNIIHLKNMEYIAWKNYLGTDYKETLCRMANGAVNYCRYYIFEHKLALKNSFKDLLNTEFYQDALHNSERFTKLISSGYFMFRLDWIIWKIKTTLR